jgi:electron transport complex protein RnfB
MILGVFETYFLPAIVLAVTGGLFGLLIGIFSKVFYVEIDTRLQDLIEMLPGLNCGACGFPGCSGLAGGILEGKADAKLCKPGKQDMRDRIKDYLEKNAPSCH